MDESILDNLSTLTKTLGEENFDEASSFDELNKNLSGALADVAKHVEEIRQSLVETTTDLLFFVKFYCPLVIYEQQLLHLLGF